MTGEAESCIIRCDDDTIRAAFDAAGTDGGPGGSRGGTGSAPMHVRTAAADFEPSQIQDLGDLIPPLLEVKAKANVAMKSHVRLEVGDRKTRPSDSVVDEVKSLLKDLDDGFRVQ